VFICLCLEQDLISNFHFFIQTPIVVEYESTVCSETHGLCNYTVCLHLNNLNKHYITKSINQTSDFINNSSSTNIILKVHF